MTKSVILKPLMTTFIIAAVIILFVRSFHRFVMRSVDEHSHVAPSVDTHHHDHRGYLGHHDFKRRSKV
jgi:hypothetical protein